MLQWTPSLVVEFAPDGTLVRTFGSGQLVFPQNLALGPDGSLYVVDRGSASVVVFKGDGTKTYAFGSPGVPGDGQFGGPRGIDVSPSGDVYVGDLWGFAVQKLATTGAVRGDLRRHRSGRRRVQPAPRGLGHAGRHRVLRGVDEPAGPALLRRTEA